ncbi:metal-dependent hydrolase [Hyphomicrobium sp.]|uniref:metal-dependent hydrolase n=1 Tax=Hyphomicrobium sp. TaxID=82 RepID=UPI0025C2488E|nr:metal-dependent hydrolase [Hyphomicrobium sp.]MCC7251305.1 metal-dependent hydrolase [Hyphomicrobium sp.]
MANFTTHIAVGTVVSGSLATLTLAADVIAPENLIPITLAGVLGSVLPDIDLKESRPSRALFGGLALFFSFAVLFTVADRYSIAELWLLWLGTLVLVRYGLHAIFHNLAVHRGTWHSLIAALFSAAATAVVFGNVMDRHAGVAWLAAGFMLIGFLVHLTLDEIYAVDIEDKRLKTSFGTALKLADRRYPYATGGMLAALALAIWLAPSPATFVAGLSSRDMWAGLNEQLLPKERWFGLVKLPSLVAETPPQEGSPITTGTIPSAAPEGGKQDAPPAAASQ